MNIQLIHGEFNSKDALELITQLIHTKIKYHENKINTNSNEEDIKRRESKIRHLQKELFDVRTSFGSKLKSVKIDASIKID